MSGKATNPHLYVDSATGYTLDDRMSEETKATILTYYRDFDYRNLKKFVEDLEAMIPGFKFDNLDTVKVIVLI